MNREELREILSEAREMQVESVEIQGIKYTLGSSPIVKQTYVEDLKPEEIVKPLSVLDEYTEEEILYYATGYFDELQEKKEAMKKQKAEDDELQLRA